MDKQSFGEDEEVREQHSESSMLRPVEYNMALRDTDVVEYWLALTHRRRSIVTALTWLGILVALRAFPPERTEWYYAAWAGLTALAWLGHFTLTVWRAKRAFASARYDMPSLWVFEPTKVTISSAVGESRMRWDGFSGVWDTHTAFLLYCVTRAEPFLMPKRGFESREAMEQFRELCRAHGLPVSKLNLWA